MMTGCGSDDANFHSSKDGDKVSTDTGKQPRDVNVRIVVDVNQQKGHRRGKPWNPSPGDSPPGDSPSGDDTVTPPSPERPGFKYSEQEEGKPSVVKTDILFYLGHKDDGYCWKYFGRSAEKSGFFSHIGDFNWQAAAAFYSHNPSLYRFRRIQSYHLGVGGNWFGLGAKPVYVLKKGLFSTDENDEYLKHTITTEYVRNIHDHYEGRGKWAGDPQFPWPYKPKKIPTDPLFGLKRLLKENPKTFVRKDSKTFIVLFNFDRYHYEPQEWKKVVEKYEDTYFIALSPRRGMVSNHPHSGLKWIPCGYTHVAQHLAEYIRNTASE